MNFVVLVGRDGNTFDTEVQYTRSFMIPQGKKYSGVELKTFGGQHTAQNASITAVGNISCKRELMASIISGEPPFGFEKTAGVFEYLTRHRYSKMDDNRLFYLVQYSRTMNLPHRWRAVHNKLFLVCCVDHVAERFWVSVQQAKVVSLFGSPVK